MQTSLSGGPGPVGRTGCKRGNGPASALLCLRPRFCPQAAKSIRRLVLDAVNLTRWSFCFRKADHISVCSFFDGLLRSAFDGLIVGDRSPDAIEHAVVLAAVKDAARR